MSDLLNIGRSGLAASAYALDTVAGNIANAENADYVRRAARRAELAAPGANGVLYRGNSSPIGVEIRGVARATDSFLEASVRMTGAALTEAEARLTIAEAAERALADEATGIGQSLARFFTSGEELAAAPNDAVLRAQFLDHLDRVAEAFRRTAGGLNTLQRDVAERMDRETGVVQSALDDLATLNRKLPLEKDGSAAQAALLDRRDTSLAALTERLDVTIAFRAEGTVAISFAGSALLTPGTDAAKIAVTTTPAPTFRVNGEATTAPTDAMLGGLFAAFGNVGVRTAQLDGLSRDFAAGINDWHNAGRTEAGEPGAALLTIGGGARDLAAAPVPADALAVRDVSGRSNGNLLALSDVRRDRMPEAGWNSLVGDQGIATQRLRAETTAAAAQYDAARDARDSLSGVDLDREAADLIRYQQAYDASARVIQVARETLQSLFAIF